MVPCHDRPSGRDDPRAADWSWATPLPELRLQLPADWLAPSLARRRLHRWLEANGWSPGQTEDIVLVASEAISNSIEHGYRVPRDAIGSAHVVDVTAAVLAQDGYRRVRLTVRDRGTWRRAAYGPSNRRHGLELMRSLMADVVVEGTADGTTVVLTSRTTIVPPPGPA